MSSFREIQSIYEQYEGFNPNAKYTPRFDVKNSAEFGGLNDPGETRPPVSIVASENEEEDGVIKKSVIRNRINELLNDESLRGMEYAHAALYDILKLVS